MKSVSLGIGQINICKVTSPGLVLAKAIGDNLNAAVVTRETYDVTCIYNHHDAQLG